MRRKVWMVCLMACIVSHLYGIEKVSMPELLADGWDQYVGKMVEITTPLYVCGNYYDSLILATERL